MSERFRQKLSYDSSSLRNLFNQRGIAERKKKLPMLSYIICASPRSGSNYLCELLRNTGHAGLPDEFFFDWYPWSPAYTEIPEQPDLEFTKI